MDAKQEADAATDQNATTVERRSDRELVVTRTFNAPARVVFAAWTRPEMLKRWWAPQSFGIDFISCELDARPGGELRFVMGHASFEKPMAFFGRYLEFVAPSRVVWTNEEAGDAGPVTTVTFEEKDGRTLVVYRDLYPSKAALDEAMVSGSTSGFDESFGQLAQLLATGA